MIIAANLVELITATVSCFSSTGKLALFFISWENLPAARGGIAKRKIQPFEQICLQGDFVQQQQKNKS